MPDSKTETTNYMTDTPMDWGTNQVQSNEAEVMAKPSSPSATEMPNGIVREQAMDHNSEGTQMVGPTPDSQSHNSI